jgi:REP element-mobilizing transposase RayT
MIKKRELIEGYLRIIWAEKLCSSPYRMQKDKFHFRLTNFCVMPTHIHLLLKPEAETSLNVIMQWVKSINKSDI